MAPALTKKRGRAEGARIPLDVWRKIRELTEDGETAPNLARRFGVSAMSIRGKCNIEKWETPLRKKRKAEAAASQKASNLAPGAVEQLNGAVEQLNGCSKHTSACLKSTFSPDALLQLAGESPEDFQRGLVKAAQVAIAQGIAEIELPKTVAELNTWVGIWRKAAGLDVKADSKTSTIISIGGGLSVRRSSVPIIDVTPDPLDDFLA